MEQADFEIIKLPPDQWQRYKEIRLEALRAEPQAFGASFEEAAQRPDSYWQTRLAQAWEGKSYWLLFAQRGNRLLGLMGAFIEVDEHRAENDPCTAEIIQVYINRLERGKGISKALLAGILAELEKTGIVHKAILGVNKKGLPAVALYRQFGFEVFEEKSVVLGDGKRHEMYLMQRPIR